MSAVALIVAFAATTLLLLRGPLRPQPLADKLALAAAGSIITLACVSLALLRLGSYSPWIASAAVVSCGVAAFAAARRWRAPLAVALSAQQERGGHIAVPLLFSLGALYALYPTYFFLGGQDPGLYLIFAARIARTGGLNLDLPWLQAVWEQHPQGIALGYPGVYSFLQSNIGDDPTRLSPQFVHLFPALASNAWSFGGLEGIVRTNALVATLCLGIGFVLARRLAGPVAGIALVLVLGLNPAFLWSARITLSEMLTALMNLTGLTLLLLAERHVSRGLAAASGVVLGLSVLCRLDAGFSGLAVFGLGLASLVDRRLGPAAKWSGSVYAVASGVGYLDAFFNAPFYFETLLGKHQLGAIIAISLTSGVGALVLGSLPERVTARLRLREAGFVHIGRAGAALLLLWVVVALFVWPAFDPRDNARAARELGWYLTPIAWPLFIVGSFTLIARRAWGQALPLLLVTLATFMAFTAGPNVVPEHVWASRRWVPHVVPLVALFAVLAAVNVIGRIKLRPPLKTLIATLVALAYAVPALDFDRVFLFRSMLAGLPAAYTAVAERAHAIGLTTPYFTTNLHVASVLTYLYDTPTVIIGGRTQYGLNDPGARSMLREGALRGLTAVGMDAFDLQNTVQAQARFEGDYPEAVRGRRPAALMSYAVPLDLGEIGGHAFELEALATDPRFVTDVGTPTAKGGLRTTGRSGALVRSARLELGAGRYELDVIGRVEAATGNQQGSVEAFADAGSKLVAASPLRLNVNLQPAEETWIAGVDFTLDVTTPDVEFRVSVDSDIHLEVTRLRIRRLGLN